MLTVRIGPAAVSVPERPMTQSIDIRAVLPSLRDEPCRYPDARPPNGWLPFLYHHGFALPLDPSGATSVEEVRVGLGDETVPLGLWLQQQESPSLEQRIPVLAIGSNAYPRQLDDKFHEWPVADDRVPVLACTVRHARIVFCARLAQSGYIPVTLRAAPERSLHTWIQWLTLEQLTQIAKSEHAYRLVECPAAEVTMEVAAAEVRPPRVYAWLSDTVLDLAGVLGSTDGLVPFAGNPLAGRDGDPAGMSERDLIHVVLRRLLRAEAQSLTWDGCSIPPERRDAVREFLSTHQASNPMADGWTRIDHIDERLLGA